MCLAVVCGYGVALGKGMKFFEFFVCGWEVLFQLTARLVRGGGRSPAGARELAC